MLVHHSSNPVTDLLLLDRLDLFVAKIITPLTETRNRTPVYIADFCLSFHWRTSYLLTKGSRNSHVSCLQSYRTFSSNIHCAPWSSFFSLSKYGFDQNIPKGTKMKVCWSTLQLELGHPWQLCLQYPPYVRVVQSRFEFDIKTPW